MKEEWKPGREGQRRVDEERDSVGGGGDVERSPAEEEGGHGGETDHSSPPLLPVQVGGGHPHLAY